jgi:hypothetical protein
MNAIVDIIVPVLGMVLVGWSSGRYPDASWRAGALGSKLNQSVEFVCR